MNILMITFKRVNFQSGQLTRNSINTGLTIQTDHRALKWMDRLKETNSRLTRWSLALQEFQLKFT